MLKKRRPLGTYMIALIRSLVLLSVLVLLYTGLLTYLFNLWS